MKRLEKKLKNLPISPGVYLFKDKKGTVIYVGKSAVLRARVKSYFASNAFSFRSALPRPQGAGRAKLVENIKDIKIIETSSEIEALVKESELIKKLKPKFNVTLRDNKSYVYVAITREDFPRILVTHQPKLAYSTGHIANGKNKKTIRHKPLALSYLGPYTDSKAIRKTLRLLRPIFPYYIKRAKPSRVEIQIGIVPADNISKPEYRKNISSIKRILKGNSKTVIRQLEKNLRAATKKENFELAAELRDKIESLNSVINHAHVLSTTEESLSNLPIFPDLGPNFKLLGLKKDPARIETYDISNISGKEATGSMVVFVRGENGRYKPKKSQYRKFKIKTIKGANDTAMMAEVVERRLKNKWPKPGLALIDGGKGQLNAVSALFAKKKIPVVSLAKRLEEVYFPGKKHPVLAEKMGLETKHLLQAMRDEAHRFAISYHRLLRKKKRRR